MYQFVFDAASIVGGIFFALFVAIVLTRHKKAAWICFIIALGLFTVALVTSYIKSSGAQSVPSQQMVASKDTIAALAKPDTVKIHPKTVSAKPVSRPRIGLEQIQIYRMRIGQPLTIEIQTINSGTATAYRIQHKSGIKTGGTGIYSKEWDSIKTSSDKVKSIRDPHEQGSFILWSDTLTAKDSVDIATGTRNLFVFGIITYTDKSGKNKYYRKYCVTYTPVIGKFADYGDCNDAN